MDKEFKEVKQTNGTTEYKTGMLREEERGKGLPSLISPYILMRVVEHKDAIDLFRLNGDVVYSSNKRENILDGMLRAWALFLIGDKDNDWLVYVIQAADRLIDIECNNLNPTYRYPLSPYTLTRFSQHMENGAVKYSADNWVKGTNFRRFANSMGRHIIALMKGLDDEDHASAVIFNAGAIIHFQETGREAELNDMPDWGVKKDE